MTGKTVPSPSSASKLETGPRVLKVIQAERGMTPQMLTIAPRVAGPNAGPSVSCLMLTRGAVFPARHAISCFLNQTYPNRELVIVCCAPDSALGRLVADLGDPRIRFLDVSVTSLGEQRNRALEAARGDLVCTWDDDDLYHPRRIADQVTALEATGAAAVFVRQVIAWWPARRMFMLTERRPWEGSMLARRGAVPAYPALDRGEDTSVMKRIREAHRSAVLDVGVGHYCYVIHGNNTSGESHFEGMASRSVRRFEGEEYTQAMNRLGRVMPLAAYAIALRGIAGARGLRWTGVT